MSQTRRKHLRFRTKPLHNVSISISQNYPHLRIANISLGGVGIFVEDPDQFESDFTGTLTVDKEKFSIRLKKVFQDDEIMGCQFLEPSPQLHVCIDKYFQTELLALNLNRVETLPTEKNEHDKTVFFHGKNNCELLVNEKKGQICYFSVIVLGNCIEVDPNGKLVVGQRITDENVPNRNGLFLFKSVEKPDPHIVNVAIRFIDSINDLTSEYKKNLIKIMIDLSTEQET